MDNDKLNRWLQIAANFGILAGLVLVGFQMNQNSDLLRFELEYAESERLQATANSMLGEDPATAWAKALTSPLDLDLREQLIVEAYLFLETENWSAHYNLAQEGLTDVDWRTRIEQDANYFLNNPYGLAYWKNLQGIWPDELVKFVDSVLEDNPGDGSDVVEFQNRIMEDVKNIIDAFDQ